MTTFGIEEEYFLVDPQTLRPVNLADPVLDDLTPGPGVVTREFLASQLERATAVFTELAEAEADLTRFRADLASAADRHGVLAIGAGTPFDAHPVPTLTDAARYHRIESGVRGVVRDHQICATHVHVGVPDRQSGVLALNTVRLWLPTLLALTGNSPFWRGRSTGFDSWRAVIMRRWATTGCPPAFIDADDYDRRLRRLIGVGATVDTATVAWYARLSEVHPTLEVRVADAQLDLAPTLLLAALTRALVVSALAEPRARPLEVEPELLDAALWQASRDGMNGQLLDPATRTLQPAGAVVASLLRQVSGALEQAGDRPQVSALLDRVGQTGTGANRQQQAFRSGGLTGLRGLLARSFTQAAISGG
ncbi:YbdK family carboxylate-amine ligase [Cryobacterium lactosi]|uniref:Putative glutamate--cysteine ligase 2 n=1 Tax=Cryobacterium lactosi TaxID=1259202 RepID=A0A4R9BY12_9MICO|nr:YbdK family carboxylate-amine ligase [Cryobacterium lactosi]TFD93351.1 YbdK family carboxylate-amine ligase [Cryobacterium lactosi]